MKVREPLAPPGLDTLTLAGPSAAVAAMVKVAVICVELTTVVPVTDTNSLLTITKVLEPKLVPVKVTETAVPWAPLLGRIEVSVGGGGLMVNDTAPLVPPDADTVTLAAPSVALELMTKLAVICVELTTTILVTVTPGLMAAIPVGTSTEMLTGETKPVPVRVTATVAP